MKSNFQHLKWLLTVLFLVLLGFSFINMIRPTRQTPPPGDPKIEKLKLQPGFIAEHIYGPSDNQQGSWVSMTFDNKGRMIASDQYGGLYRLEIPPVGSASVTPKIEKLQIGTANTIDTNRSKVEMGYAQGLLYAFNSLYVMVNHNSDSNFAKGSGLYRLQDTDGNDQYDKVTLLKALKGEGEHGPHSIVLAPDKKSLFIIAGNHTDVPQLDAYRLPRVWKEDNLFPLIKDPRGHATDRMAPGGWIANVDSTGTRWELFGAGFRNAFDLTFNEAGEMFAYDSDMEWDFGLPWYRPTRICHVTSGSEFGWRTGNSKWSPNYPDNLPATLNIGQGSPTNFVNGHNAKFSEKYKKALFAFDWSFGIIYAIHLKPKGASYSADAEEFLSGSPLPLTDGVIGPDGALYFMTGGRRLQSDVYRVYYKGSQAEASNSAITASAQVTPEMKIRRELEQYHGEPKAGAVDFAWPYLKHNDRFVRYAARVAIEHQPVSEWQDRALKEKDPQTAIQAGIALTHQANASLNNQLLATLMQVNFGKLNNAQQEDMVRTIELVFARMGEADPQVKSKVIAYLSPFYPAKTNDLNRILSKVLVYLEAPDAVSKTMALMATAKDDNSQKNFTESSDLILRNPQYGLDIAGMLSKVPPAQQTYYATVLSKAKTGWTPALQEKYFKWYHQAFNFKGGRSFVGFLDHARKYALANVSKERFAHFNTISGDSLLSSSGNDLANVAQPKGPGKNWSMEEALPLVESGLTNRNLEQGKAMYAATLCKSCHAIGGEGGAVGPDLTQLGTRFTPKDILESIIAPSKVVSDQYAATVFYLKTGGSVLGRLINQDQQKYYISQNPFAPDMLREIQKKDVSRTRVSEISIMLPGLINRLNEEELKDLMAYLMSGGNKNNAVYSAKR